MLLSESERAWPLVKVDIVDQKPTISREVIGRMLGSMLTLMFRGR